MMLRMSVIEGVQAAQARLDAAVALGAVVCRDDQAALVACGLARPAGQVTRVT